VGRRMTATIWAFLALTICFMMPACSGREPEGSSVVKRCEVAADCAPDPGDKPPRLVCFSGTCRVLYVETTCVDGEKCDLGAVCVVDPSAVCDGCGGGICVSANECPADSQCIPGTQEVGDAGLEGGDHGAD